MNTFTNKEWGYGKDNTAIHHDRFCLWPSWFTRYTIPFKQMLKFDPASPSRLGLSIVASRVNPVLAEIGRYQSNYYTYTGYPSGRYFFKPYIL